MMSLSIIPGKHGVQVTGFLASEPAPQGEQDVHPNVLKYINFSISSVIHHTNRVNKQMKLRTRRRET